jgi:hypothetical protein
MTRSIQQTANSANSTSVIEVGSSAGFSAGDLVYYQNGDYKGAPNMTLPSSATFPLTANMPVSQQAFVNSFSTAGSATGGSNGRGAAVLTNGNIVQVLMNASNGVPYFKIVDTSNTVVVAPTIVSGTYTNTSNATISVIALTGGGFVVFWVNSAGGTTQTMNYAIYTNTGSITTGATQDTSFSLGGTYNQINGVALANGGFVLGACTAGGPNVVFRGYGATGTATYSLVTLSPAATSAQYWFGISARSDSSFIFVYQSSSTLFNYAIYTAAGSSSTTGTFSTASGTLGGPDVTTLSDGTTFVIAYCNYLSSKYTPCFRFLPTGNSLGAENTIPTANINGGGMRGYATPVLGLSGGNFIMLFGDATSNYYGLNYVVYNSSGTPVIATNASGIVPLTLTSININTYAYTLPLETSTGIYFHWITADRGSYFPWNTNYCQISKTTYLPTGSTTASTLLGTGSGTSSGLGYSGSVPTALATAAASTGNISIQTSTAYVVNPTLLYSTNAVMGTSSATFPDGKFVIAYIDSINFKVYASVFSVGGVLQTTITVGTAYATQVANNISVTTLSSGKFAVTYMTTSTVVTNALYSSTYSLISSVDIASTAALSAGYGVSNCGLSNDRYAVGYHRSSGYPSYVVYDATNTLISGPTTVISAGCNNIGLCANAWGGFYITYYYSGAGSVYVNLIQNTTGTTYTNPTQQTYGAQGACYGGRPSFGNGNVYSLMTANSSSYAYVLWSDEGCQQIIQSGTIYSSNVQSYSNVAIGTTALGNPVLFYPNNSPTQPNLPIWAWTNKTAPFSSAPITFPNNSTFALTGSGTFVGNSNFGSLPTVTANIANNVVVAWLTTSGSLYYAIVNAVPVCANLVATAGVTSSTTTPVSPTATTTTSTAISGTFVGVAASTAPSGGSGQVVVNGVAKLNANYTGTASGAFDHTGLPVNGVKGTYKGNIVNLQGNLT